MTYIYPALKLLLLQLSQSLLTGANTTSYVSSFSTINIIQRGSDSAKEINTNINYINSI